VSPEFGGTRRRSAPSGSARRGGSSARGGGLMAPRHLSDLSKGGAGRSSVSRIGSAAGSVPRLDRERPPRGITQPRGVCFNCLVVGKENVKPFGRAPCISPNTHDVRGRSRDLRPRTSSTLLAAGPTPLQWQWRSRVSWASKEETPGRLSTSPGVQGDGNKTRPSRAGVMRPRRPGTGRRFRPLLDQR
jgi:hypothetical protein